MAKVEFWVIRPSGSDPDLPSLVSQSYHQEMFLSPHVRMSGFNSMAHVESEELARSFAEACTPILQKRYGSDFFLCVEASASSEKSVSNRIKKDSDIIRKRLDTANFAPNKAPE